MTVCHYEKHKVTSVSHLPSSMRQKEVGGRGRTKGGRTEVRAAEGWFKETQYILPSVKLSIFHSWHKTKLYDTVITCGGGEESYILNTRRIASWLYHIWLVRHFLSLFLCPFLLFSHFCLTRSLGLACWHASAQALSTSPLSRLEFTLLTVPIH